MSNEETKKFSIKDCLIVNGIFWLYCILQMLLIKLFLGELTGMGFFFVVIAVGFTLMYFFNFFFDKLYKAEEVEIITEETKEPEQSEAKAE